MELVLYVGTIRLCAAERKLTLRILTLRADDCDGDRECDAG